MSPHMPSLVQSRHTTRRRPAAATLYMVATAALLLTGCNDIAVGPSPRLTNQVIADEVNNVFLPNFDSLATRGTRLSADINALVAAATPNALAAAQADWKLARASYEFGEAFSFGPIQTDGIDPAVDSWPVDVSGINTLIAGTDPITTESIHALPTTLKGFHAVEFVLFGPSGAPTTATSLTARQLEFLLAAGQDLSNELTALRTAWDPAQGNFAAQVLNAGRSGSAYSSQNAAMQDIVTQMSTQPAQVIYKLSQPLTTDSSIYEESLFSDNTLGDIQSNIAGTAALYFGGSSSMSRGGLSTIVAASDPALDATVRAQFAEATAKLALIVPSFNTALQSDPVLLQNAEQAVLSLQKTMINLVAPLLGVGSAGPLGGQSDND
jgi:putative iron-regulated protein